MSKSKVIKLSFRKLPDIEAADLVTRCWNQQTSQFDLYKAARLFGRSTKSIFIYSDATSTKGVVMRWCGTHWVDYPRLSVLADATKIYGKFLGSIKKQDEFIRALSLARHTTSLRFTLKPKIYLRNGVYNLETRKLEKHDRKNFNTFVLPIKYDRNATAPRWCDFLADVIGIHDEQAGWVGDTAQIGLIQEYIGYCLQPSCDLEKLMLLFGSGSNGKSTFIKTVLQLFGSAATLFALEEFKHKFTRGKLRGKLLAYHSDEESGHAPISNIIRTFSSGEMMRGEDKGLPVFEFWNTAKGLWATNSVPNFEDKGFGTERRLLVVEFNRNFETEKMVDTKVQSKLKAELPGILNWAIEGYHTLRERGNFNIPPLTRNATKDFMADNDTVRSWLAECTEEADTDLLTAAAFTSYAAYCRKNQVDKKFIFNRNRFGRHARKVLGIPSSHNKDGATLRGLRLKNPTSNIKPTP